MSEHEKKFLQPKKIIGSKTRLHTCASFRHIRKKACSFSILGKLFTSIQNDPFNDEKSFKLSPFWVRDGLNLLRTFKCRFSDKMLTLMSEKVSIKFTCILHGSLIARDVKIPWDYVVTQIQDTQIIDFTNNWTFLCLEFRSSTSTIMMYKQSPCFDPLKNGQWLLKLPRKSKSKCGQRSSKNVLFFRNTKDLKS